MELGVSNLTAQHNPPLAQSGIHEESRNFEIAAGDVPTALGEFSGQANKQVLFDFNVVRNRQTRAVSGTLPPSEALRTMLKGTGLVANSVNERTIAVTPPRASPKAPTRS
jgi:iron complex outermembrane recepter protein